MFCRGLKQSLTIRQDSKLWNSHRAVFNICKWKYCDPAADITIHCRPIQLTSQAFIGEAGKSHCNSGEASKILTSGGGI